MKMGRIVNKLCKNIVVTDDNPRHEDAKKITKQIYNFIRRGQIINNRKKAINIAIKNTSSEEVLLVAGKGHENYQIIKDKKVYFSDQREIIKNL